MERVKETRCRGKILRCAGEMKGPGQEGPDDILRNLNLILMGISLRAWNQVSASLSS